VGALALEGLKGFAGAVALGAAGVREARDGFSVANSMVSAASPSLAGWVHDGALVGADAGMDLRLGLGCGPCSHAQSADSKERHRHRRTGYEPLRFTVAPNRRAGFATGANHQERRLAEERSTGFQAGAFHVRLA
jgi:hypothetical protein